MRQENDMKIRVLFYKAKWDGHLLDDGISLWTGIFNWGTGPYSHAEIWIPNNDGEFHRRFDSDDPRNDFGYYHAGWCYTSTMRDDVNGVVKRPAAQVLKHLDRWDYIEIEVEDGKFDVIKKWMDLEVKNNDGYDVWCIVSFFWYKRVFAGNKFICSEFCAFVLWIRGIFKKPRCPSPRRLSRWLVDKGYKIQSLA